MTDVLIAQFAHETNTFSRLPTTLEDYRRRWLLEGDEIVPRFRGTRTEIGGLIDYAEKAGWQLVPTVAANATPSGKLTRETWETIRDRILARARNAADVSGAVLALHGAMVSETEDDAEGALLEALRGVLGASVPIVVTLDLHANATPRMAKHANALISYRTYPHTDQYERAQQAATLLDRIVAGSAKAQTVLVQPPTSSAPTTGARCSPGRCATCSRWPSASSRKRGSTRSASRRASCRPTSSGPALRWRYRTIRRVPTARLRLQTSYRTRSGGGETKKQSPIAAVDEVVRAVKADPGGGPLVIADGTDNPGGGGYGDATNLLRALIAGAVQGCRVGHLYDPAAVQAAIKAGAGKTLRVRLGGHIDPAFGAPIETEAHVQSLSDGSFINDGPMGQGRAQRDGADRGAAHRRRRGDRDQQPAAEHRPADVSQPGNRPASAPRSGGEKRPPFPRRLRADCARGDDRRLRRALHAGPEAPRLHAAAPADLAARRISGRLISAPQ
jgi:microcystin degradation protein MlrC